MELTKTVEIFKLLGELTRFRIIHLLIERGPICVQTLQKTLNEPQVKISRHLSALRASGLVAVRREGQMRHYSLPAADEYQKRLIKFLKEDYFDLKELQKDLQSFDELDAQGLLCCRPRG